ncbi:HAD family hydrolase [Pseudomonas sp.]|uniref:HAD family hydrolase n=1 Tax=Pseudomonas sp. TaxID=306 RepID=UPI000C88F7F1|nr:HAD family hydrolase [Pseudomonadales bacterium]|tara:strand:+ start:1364 stop:1942 length:579 start_codon:yes stop_codon:yes gene_type:complete
MHQLRGWVFDLDGTLTLAQHDFPAIRRELGVPADADILTYMATLPAADYTAMKAQLDAIELRLAAEVEPAPGAVELVRQLREQGRRLGILTRNLQVVARSTLSCLGILDCFAAEDVLGREDAAPKPSPNGIHQLLDRWQLSPDEVVMVGDFRFDLEAGRAAGSRTCLILPDNPWPELTDWHLPSCNALLARL